MKYEDMSMSQLKSLCRDKGLGTGRSKQELIDKLVAHDNRVNEPVDDTDLTEEQIDDLMEKGEPVDLEPAQEVKTAPVPTVDEDPSPTVFRISFSHSGALLDTEHEAYRKRTYGLAQAEGLKPFGGEMAPRLVKVENGQLTYEVEVHG
jgi:hypothetical protein